MKLRLALLSSIVGVALLMLVSVKILSPDATQSLVSGATPVNLQVGVLFPTTLHSLEDAKFSLFLHNDGRR